MKESPRIRTSMFRAAMGAVLISITLVAFLSISLIVTVLPKEVNERNDLALHFVSQQMENYFHEYEKDFLSLASLINNSRKYSHISDQDLFTSLSENSFFFSSLFLLDSMGVAKYSVGQNSKILGVDYSGEPFFWNARKRDKIVWSRVFLSQIDSRPHVVLSTYVGSDMLVADVSLDQVKTYMQQLPKGFGGTLRLLDQSGGFLYDIDSIRVLEREYFSNFADISKTFHLGNVSHHEVIEHGQSWSASIIPLQTTGWSVLLLSDPSRVFQTLWILAGSIVGLSLFIVISFYLFWRVMFNRVVDPLDRLFFQFKNMSDGALTKVDMHARFQEFELIQKQFNDMVDILQDRREQLEQLNHAIAAELEENKRSSEAFSAIMRTLASAMGDDLFQLIVKVLGEWLRVDMVVLGQVSSDGLRLIFRAHYDRGSLPLGQSIPLDASPFALTSQNIESWNLTTCSTRFSANEPFVNLKMDWYCGVPINDRVGNCQGVLAILSEHPRKVSNYTLEVMKILADRVSAEFVRSGQESALKILNRDLTEMTRSLSIKNSEMESMLYITSHDLKAPLVNIVGFSKELQESLQDIRTELLTNGYSEKSKVYHIMEQDIPQCLHYIQGGVLRMEKLLNGLLKLFRVGRSPLDRKLLRLEPLLKTLMDEIQYQLRELNVVVKIEGLPDCYGDESQLSQVFHNLFSNAIKYRDPSRSLEIHIGGKLVERGVEFSFSDNGLGVSDADKARVFQLFFRAANSRGVSGDGLGLTIVQRIIEQHGGSIRLESKVGTGTTFLIVLPSPQSYSG